MKLIIAIIALFLMTALGCATEEFFHGKRVYHEAGCSIMPEGPRIGLNGKWYKRKAHIECAGPGIGLCWAKGYNPMKGETPWAIDVGNPGANHKESECD